MHETNEPNTGTLTSSEAPDQASATGAVEVRGELHASEAADGAAVAGIVEGGSKVERG